MSEAATIESLLKLLQKRFSAEACAVVTRSARALLATDAPAGEHRLACDAAHLLAEFRADPETVAAALLVPVLSLESEDAPPDSELPAAVLELSNAATRLVNIRWNKIDSAAAETLRKMFLAMAQDVRVVLIVLSLRVALMRQMVQQAAGRSDAEPDDGGASVEERQRLAQETLDVFAPLANRLGVWQFKWELEDHSLSVLEPQTYQEVNSRLLESREERLSQVGEFVRELSSKLDEAGIAAKTSGRAKHVFSIVNKMRKKQLTFEQLFDVSAVRVVVEELPHCYAALGVVHSTWVPLPHEFDDYIAMPKANGYQSLHTVVMGPRGRPVEVQIRTRAMHEFAEYGVAAHWRYKEGKSDAQPDKFRLLRQLLDWEREVLEPEQFVQNVKTDLFEDQVFVFTRDGDVVSLPKGATALDFAYRVHTMVGHRCRGARVNDKLVPLDTRLRTGDRIEVLTHKLPQPSRDWLNPAFGYLRTNSARNKVRQWFRQQEREEAVSAGRELTVRELKRLNLRQVSFERLALSLNYKHAEDLFAAVGYGDRSSQSVSSTALQLERASADSAEQLVPESAPPAARLGRASGLSLGGVGEIQGQRAGCCRPVPGDAVVGFVTRGRGLIIHRRDCSNVLDSLEPERLVDIDWGDSGSAQYVVELALRVEDHARTMAELLNIVSFYGIRTIAAKSEPVVGDVARAGESDIRLSLQCKNADQVTHALEKLAQHRDVLEVHRKAQ